MKEVSLLKEYCGLDEYFKKLEEASAVVSQTSGEQYLCVRLDGIGLSKKYLKDVLRDSRFTGLMWSTVEATYEVLHRKAPTNAQNIFLAVIICSDEVSIILNNQKNYYDGRLFKIVTTFASTFSSFFTGNGFTTKRKKKEVRIGGSFDGRPLLLENLNEVSQYMAYRYSTYIRNTNSKLLRLEGLSSEDLYSNINFNNIDFYQEEIEKIGIQEKSDIIPNDPVVFIPNSSGELHSFRFQALSEFIENIPVELSKFDFWLKEKCA